MTRTPTATAALAALAGIFFASASITPATADLAVRFNEGAPKDRFTFQNVGSCPITDATLSLDLSGSEAGLIFDVTAAGAGVEVFQPLEFVSGAGALASMPTVKDGENTITMDVSSLEPGDAIAFTIDVDDTMGGREITVANSEIVGAVVQLSRAGGVSSHTFTRSARGTIPLTGC
ncbi:MAG: aggregation factor core [Pseudomonadota bacterium]